MFHIVILSSSIRLNRNSHRAAIYFQKYLQDNHLASTEIIDLKEKNFPLFDERLAYHPAPTEEMLVFSGQIKKADGVILVTPEYNGGYPAALKNAIDLLYDEWYKKPIAIATASDGDFGGTQVITSLLFTLWKIRAWVAPVRYPIPRVQDAFDENGIPADKKTQDKRTKVFINELLWCIESNNRMKDYKPAIG